MAASSSSSGIPLIKPVKIRMFIGIWKAAVTSVTFYGGNNNIVCIACEELHSNERFIENIISACGKISYNISRYYLNLYYLPPVYMCQLYLN